MRIKQIKVEKLFGIFDHVIDFNLEERITIIIGDNGIGKTKILNCISYIFSGLFEKLISIPFNKISISFENEQQISIERVYLEDDYVLNISDPQNTQNTFTVFIGEAGESFNLQNIFEINPYLSRIDVDEFYDERESKIYSREELQSKYRKAINKSNSSDWFDKISEKIRIKFINTNRLFASRIDDMVRSDLKLHSKIRRINRNVRRQDIADTIIIFSLDMVDRLIKANRDYSILSAQLDRSFPIRLIKYNKISSTPDIRNKLRELDDLWKEMASLGILRPDSSLEELQSLTDQDITDNIKNLSVYVEDANEKLSIFENLSKKIDVFKNIMNKRMKKYKIFDIDRNDGFAIFYKDTPEDKLDLIELS
jgi:hypothetical protein